MMIFVESPWPILFIGIAIEAVLALLLLRTGLGKYLIAMIGVAVVVAAGLVVEHFVITDRKAVAQTLDAAVAAVRTNNLQGRSIAFRRRRNSAVVSQAGSSDESSSTRRTLAAWRSR